MEIINVTRSMMPPKEEYFREIDDIWDSCWLTNMGRHHEKLCGELKEYLNVDNLSLLSSGHMALEAAIQALGLSGEVITTPFTFVSTIHALVRNGIRPVFCDIRRDDFTLDWEKIEALITDKTTAILPVHVYGNVCDVDRIDEIAHKHHLKVLYDASHAFGETYRGQAVASYGDASTFSFHATKVFHTIEGGAVCSDSADLTDKVNRIRNFGIVDAERVDDVGFNAKMNEFQAAMGSCNLRYIEEEIHKRKSVYDEYISCLENCRGIRLNKIKDGVKSNYAYFPIFIEEDFGTGRDELCEYLRENGIYARKYFYPLVSDMACYANQFHEPLPVAKETAGQVMTLPLYGELDLGDVHRICDMIHSCLG